MLKHIYSKFSDIKSRAAVRTVEPVVKAAPNLLTESPFLAGATPAMAEVGNVDGLKN